MAGAFLLLIGAMAAIALANPLAPPKVLPVRREMDVRTSPPVCAAGAGLILAPLSFFVALA